MLIANLPISRFGYLIWVGLKFGLFFFLKSIDIFIYFLYIIYSMGEKSKILEKASKLIAMMTSSNVNEVENASKLLQNLIEKYDLDINLINKISNKTEIVQEDGLEMSSYQINGWQSILAGAVTKFYDCSAYRSHNWWKKTSSIVIVGFEPDKTIAKEFISHLSYLIESEATFKSMNDNPNFINGKKFKHDFSIGATFAISTRLKDLKWAQKLGINHEDSKALVVVKDKAIIDYIGKKKLKKSSSTKYDVNDEFHSGYDYGSKVNLSSKGSLE